MTEKESAACPKIAIIAVHGVADQAPHETARSVASLLFKRNVDATHLSYDPFNETPIQIPNHPVLINDRAKYERTKKTHTSRWQRLKSYITDKLDERSPYILELHKKERAVEQSVSGNNPQADPPDYGFMHGQLQLYKGEGPGATYDSLRLEGARLDSNGKRQQDVHIFEVYWADLSRLGSTFTQIFNELYQLLFHLASLGRQTIDFARLESGNQKSRVWALLSRLQSWAVRMLTLPLTILNLYVLAVVLILIPIRLPDKLQGPIALSLIAALLAYLYGRWSFRKGKNLHYLLWGLNAVIWTALITFLAFVFSSYFLGEGNSLVKMFDVVQQLRIPFLKLLGVEWCVVSACGLWSLMRMYARRRPGAEIAHVLMGVPIFGALIILIILADNTWQSLTVAALTMLEVLHLLLYLSWSIFLLLQFCAAVTGLLATLRAPKEKTRKKESARNRAARATYTARFSLALPAALILFLNVMIFFTIAKAGDSFLQGVDYAPRLWLLSHSIKTSGESVPNNNAVMNMTNSEQESPSSAQMFIKRIIERGYLAFAIMVITFGLAVLFAICSVAPIVLAEARPPKIADQDSQVSNQLGYWLSRGFRQMRLSGELIFFSTAIIYPLSAIYFFDKIPFEWVNKILQGVGGLLAASTAGLVISGLRVTALRKQWDTLSGKLNKVSLGFRPALDVALDVDNHLREHPRERNPRARICARYVSLLRYICKWKDPDDGLGYDAILIVSHSQGTVITADLLRFLKQEPDAELDKLYAERAEKHIPIYLLTMGCPLRQLYSLRFPHLYNWSRHTDLKQWNKDKPLHIPGNQSPDPQELGVAVWMNAFRSGDYVGRYLWRSDKCAYQWDHKAISPDEPLAWTSALSDLVTITRDEKGLRQEFCIRPGAHTHYLDETAPEISAAIDHLIKQATAVKCAAKGGG